jgi:radical SAM superfamily enzyme YgiQ (UPF0313 family)
MPNPKPLFSYRPYWAKRFGTAPLLPMSRAEMDQLGWDSCDIILVTGDAYVDHPSFGMAVIGRVLEAQGFRVGIIAQPDWTDVADFQALGRPNLFFGVTAGNMDSMVNRYTADRKLRSDDAYTPDGEGGRRPDRSVIVYAQRAREAFPDVPLVVGGIEASLRRIAHYDYWSDKVRRSVLVDAKADLLVYGNGERQVVEIAHRLAAGEAIGALRDIRGTAFMTRGLPEGWGEIDSTELDQPGHVAPHPDPYAASPEQSGVTPPAATGEVVVRLQRRPRIDREHSVIRLPAFEAVQRDPVLYAHASRVLHLETNPGNARALVQRHGDRDVWLNPPPIPLTTAELDRVFELPYTRQPHPAYHGKKHARLRDDPLLGEHHARLFRRLHLLLHHRARGPHHPEPFRGFRRARDRDHPRHGAGFHRGDLRCRRSDGEHVPAGLQDPRDRGGLPQTLVRVPGHLPQSEHRSCAADQAVSARARLAGDQEGAGGLGPALRPGGGITGVCAGTGDHHVGGYLKIAPEHTESGPLSKMMKPGMGAYDRFKELFEKFSKQAGKEQYLIPYFIAAHPGTTDEDMLQLALWLKRNGFRADQVQTFLPSPMATATAMYHSGKNPLRKITHGSEDVFIPKGLRMRRLHKAFLRYHDANNWPLLREALKRMGREDLIGNGKRHLVPTWQPQGTGDALDGRRAQPAGTRPFRTQHTGLPQTPAVPVKARPGKAGAGKRPRPRPARPR